MKTTRKYYISLSIGLLVANVDFMLKHLTTVDDFWTGVLKGTGIAIMIMSLWLMSKHKRLVRSTDSGARQE